MKLGGIGVLICLVHILINYLLAIKVSLSFIVCLHLFYLVFLVLTNWIIAKKSVKNYDRVWVVYIGIASIKFFTFLGYIYWLKTAFEISKTQALLHVFLWFFVYTLIEIKALMKILKINKRGIFKN